MLYLTLFYGWITIVPRFLIWCLLGFDIALISVNVCHDALHGSFTPYRKLNQIIGYSFDFIGANSYVWNETHNKGHHTYTNVEGMDPDIDQPDILRLTTSGPLYPIHRYQHYYMWFLYSLVAVNWIYQSDYSYFWENRKTIPTKEWFSLIFFKLLHFVVLVLLPLLFAPMSALQVIIGYFGLLLTGGLTIAIVFQLAHVVEELAFPIPDSDGIIKQNWGAHELATTSDFATDSVILSTLLGGLNFQVEHHLLPNISHTHYFHIAPIVKKTAEEFGLPYHAHPTMTSAIQSHVRLLKRLGVEKELSYETV